MKKLCYEVIHSLMTLEEKKNNKDIEFTIKAKNGEAFELLHKIRNFFESDKIYTDVLFYTQKEQTYQVICRPDSYVPFILVLFQYQLLERVEWV
ncbi:hypothetical protein EV207_11625 [Scopulibacillus darangshiensis]|uniref:Uncharacterized protein n=1 Tax=Scopulibacillus darangshiensis TaxID=442528 RepID=A0A4R2P4N3_9BACL|nr:hypothetical protein [Scopulibacillus darangshiensis]TCP28715.1 hypothetical protein EV207_11625 [Scopulibacillus darangshiensis]